jgi:hypothetical protein
MLKSCIQQISTPRRNCRSSECQQSRSLTMCCRWIKWLGLWVCYCQQAGHARKKCIPNLLPGQATCWALLDNNISVLAIYSKSAGKAGKHNWVSDSSNIMAVSNIPIQNFEHFLGVQFWAIHSGQVLHVQRFCLLPLSAFLCTLDSVPTTVESGLKVSQQDWSLFKILKDDSDNIVKAIKSLNGHKNKSHVEEGDEEEED